MKQLFFITKPLSFLILLITLSATTLYSQSNRGIVADYKRTMVTAVPDSFKLDTFYKKYADAYGIPIVSSDKAPDDALLMARDIVNYMLVKRPDIRKELINRHARVLVMAESEMETDLPERSNWKKPTKEDRRLTPRER